MRIFRATYKDRKERARESSKWYVEFRDHLQTVRRLAGFTDRKATEELGRNLERLVEMQLSGAGPDAPLARWLEALPVKMRENLTRIGLLDSKRAGASKPLAEHLEDFRKSLVAKETTAKYIKLTVSRVSKVLDGCRIVFWSDISASGVQNFLAELRGNGEGISVQTSNYYLQAAKQFCRWMVKDGRASESPLDYLDALNPRTDRRHQRRALSVDECRNLIAAAMNGPVCFGMRGPERALLYRLDLETGLRAAELGSLTRSSFRLDGEKPTVTVLAAYSKHRREDVLPLREATAAELALHLALKLPSAKAFAMPARSAAMLREDLTAAGIPYVDDDGRHADFHALRHTFITNLANSGIHPKTAQTLARHSTITLTMDRYTHTVLETQKAAVAQLPDLSLPTAAEVRATGTDGESVLASCLASESGEHATRRDPKRQKRSTGAKRETPLEAQERPALAGVAASEDGSGGGTRTPDKRIMIPLL